MSGMPDKIRQGCRTLVEIARARASAAPERIAYRFLPDGEGDGATLSHAELDAKARAVAARLQDMGMSGRTCLLLYPTGFDFLGAFYGCLYAGAIPVPVPLTTRGDFLTRIVRVSADARCALLLTTEVAWMGLRATVREGGGLPPRHFTDTIFPESAPAWIERDPDPAGLAYLQYTSGSTSEPKGVMVSHANILHNAECIRAAFQLGPEDVSASWLPHFHDMGLVDGIIEPMFSGFPAVLMSPMAFLQKPFRWLSAVSRFRVTHSGGPNFAFDACVRKIREPELDLLDLSCWRSAYNGSEPVRVQTLEAFAERFARCGFRRESAYPCYGLAESTLMLTGSALDTGPVHCRLDPVTLANSGASFMPGGSDAAGRLSVVGCGRACEGLEVRIVDPSTRLPLPPLAIGEIWAAGGSVALGYWEKPEATRETFAARLAGDAGGKPYLRTGDLGFLGRDGEVFVTGRLKDLIIVGGSNHFPQDIEWTVSHAHPALAAGLCAAFSLDEAGSEKLGLVQEVVRTARKDFDAEEVIRAIRKAVSEDHGLTVHAISLIPPGRLLRTSSGKIRRAACRQAIAEGRMDALASWTRVSGRSGSGAPASRRRTGEDLRRFLREAVAAQMGVEPGAIDPREPFSSHGFESKDAVALSGEIGERMGRNLPATLLYDYPTLGSLSAHLLGEEESTEPVEKPVGAGAGSDGDAIAILGMGCRFPGEIYDLAGFWKLLSAGGSVSRRYRPRPETGDAEESGRDSPWGAFLSRIEGFDPLFFSISPAEAEAMDPQQRLLLMVAWEALENAGIIPSSLAGTPTLVVVGASNNDYLRLSLEAGRAGEFLGTGNSLAILANRLSYFLDLRGRSLAVDTACSSSLVAVHQACASLRSGEANLALAGAVNLVLAPELSGSFSATGLLAADGRCKAFDAGADGYVRGEGCAMVVLKRLADAVSDGDPVLAVIRGVSTNQDGRSNGLTAPNRTAQEDVLRAALRDAGLRPTDIGYVEAHGAGTALGDPIEVGALAAVYGRGRSRGEPLLIGSVKSNVGHLEAASGMAGLAKTVLALRRGEIPASLHVAALNPHVPWDELPIEVVRSHRPWPAGLPRRAGLSSFGFGGTNAHVILEMPTAAEESGASRPLSLAVFSAKTPSALEGAAARLAEHCLTEPDLSIADFAYTLAAGREAFPLRGFAVAGDRDGIARAMRAEPGAAWGRGKARADQPGPVFLFAGLGEQYPGMAVELHRTEPCFRRHLEQCLAVLETRGGPDYRGILFAAGGAARPARQARPGDPDLRRMLAGEMAGELHGELDRAAIAHPLLFSIGYSLARMWMEWGIMPSAMAGHSLGEYVAACVAGVFGLEDALRLVVRRAAIMETAGPGAMLAVALPCQRASELVGEGAWVSLDNGPGSVVVSGTAAAVAALRRRLEAEGIAGRPLQAEQAFHCELMRPISGPFMDLLAEVPMRDPGIPLLSNLTGRRVLPGEMADPSYWLEHACAPVRFRECLDVLLAEGHRAFLEVGPGQALTSMLFQNLPAGEAGEALALSSLPNRYTSGSDLLHVLSSLGGLWAGGFPVDWAAFYRHEKRAKRRLPAYPFDLAPYWIPKTLPGFAGKAPASPGKAGMFYRPGFRRAGIELAAVRGQGGSQGTLLVFADSAGLWEDILREYGPDRERAIVVRPVKGAGQPERSIDPRREEDFSSLFESLATERLAVDKVLYLWELEEGGPARERGDLALLYLARGFRRHYSDAPLSILVATSGMLDVTGGEPIDPDRWRINGPALVLPQEMPGISVKIVDIAPARFGVSTRAALRGGILEEFSAGPEQKRVALRGVNRWVPCFEPVPPGQVERGATLLRPGGVYLVTGGLGRIGSALAGHLAGHYGATVILCGRSRLLPPRAAPEVAGDAGSDGVTERWRRFEDLQGRGGKVEYHSADVSDLAAMESLVRGAEQRWGCIDGVIHAAGSLEQGGLVPAQQAREEDFSFQEETKVRALGNLEKIFSGRNPGFIFVSASLSSILGGPGLVAYATANSYLEGFLRSRVGRSGLNWIGLHWEHWNPSAGPGAVDAPATAGGLDPGDAGVILELALSGGLPAHAVQSMTDLESRLRRWVHAAASVFAPEGGAYARPALDTRFVEPESTTEKAVASILAAVLRIDKVGLHDNFFHLGGNSLMGVQVASRLYALYQVSISLADFFRDPTVKNLAGCVEELILGEVEAMNNADDCVRPTH